MIQVTQTHHDHGIDREINCGKSMGINVEGFVSLAQGVDYLKYDNCFRDGSNETIR